MIIVTGATGLVGSHLLAKLVQEKEQVKALFRSEKKIENTKKVFEHLKLAHFFDRIQWIKGDILDIPSLESAFQGITHVYHCAALVSFEPKDKNALKKINIEGTANVVNCCIAFGIKKLAYISTIAALGEPKPNETTITEASEWDVELFHSDYSLTKYAAEMEVWRGFHEGLHVVIVNPGVIFGFGFVNLGSEKFIKWVKDGSPFYSDGIIGIVAVEDLIFCLTTLMNSTISGERYIVVGENCTYKELFFYIASQLNIRKPFIYTPNSALAFLWRVDWFLSFITGKDRRLTRATAIAANQKSTYSTAKIQKAIPIHFSKKENFLKAILKLEVTQ